MSLQPELEKVHTGYLPRTCVPKNNVTLRQMLNYDIIGNQPYLNIVLNTICAPPAPPHTTNTMAEHLSNTTQAPALFDALLTHVSHM